MLETSFTLRQETPIIHFLHDQPGATLRATELKPKLDKWLKDNIENIPQSWISVTNDKGHTSYDYKISIRPTGNQHRVALEVNEKFDRESRKNKLETAAFPHLLGNMGGKEFEKDLKNLVLYDGAEIVIKTWHNELLNNLNIELPKLLCNTNFGNRSGKGFGSFTCLNTPAILPSLRYCFDWEVQGNNPLQQQKDLFTAINWFYKCLRSGINQVNREGKTEFYFKSLLFAFAEQKGERWDKFSIKNHFFTGGDIPKNPVDYRDWLGFSTEEMWGKQYFNQKINKSAEIPPEKGVPGSKKKEVERLASPILFKPIRTNGNHFKVWFDKVDFPDTEFAKAVIEVKSGNKSSLYLTPSSKFDFPAFFKFAFEDTDLDEHLDRFDRNGLNPSRHWIYKDFIQPIFSSIQNNLQPA